MEDKVEGNEEIKTTKKVKQSPPPPRKLTENEKEAKRIQEIEMLFKKFSMFWNLMNSEIQAMVKSISIARENKFICKNLSLTKKEIEELFDAQMKIFIAQTNLDDMELRKQSVNIDQILKKFKKFKEAYSIEVTLKDCEKTGIIKEILKKYLI